MTKLQDEIEAKGLWDLDSKVDQAMDAPGLVDDQHHGSSVGQRASVSRTGGGAEMRRSPDADASRGNVKRKTAPPPGRSSTQIRPP